eukprot:jgi/Picsp_1/315/NSC_00314-R1_protein
MNEEDGADDGKDGETSSQARESTRRDNKTSRSATGDGVTPSALSIGGLDKDSILNLTIPHSRKRTRQGRYLSEIPFREVLECIHLPSHDACTQLGLGLTSFKRLCRGLGIVTWPYKVGKPVNRDEVIAAAIDQLREDAGCINCDDDCGEIGDGVEAVQRTNLRLNENEKAVLCRQLLEVLELSTRMRTQLNFTIFNDKVLLALYRKFADRDGEI